MWRYQGGDNFGQTVSVSGTIMAVGVPNEDSQEGEYRHGVVYIFKRIKNSWLLQTTIKIPKGADYIDNGTSIGTSVALSGNQLVIGESYHQFTGAVYVYEYADETWQQKTMLKPENLTVRNLFGASVAIDGDTIVVGAKSVANPSYGDAVKPGSAYVFTKYNDEWSQVAQLKAKYQIDGNLFGYSVDIDKDYIVIGAPMAKTRDANGEVHYGTAFAFNRRGEQWSRIAELVSPESNSEYYLPFNSWRIHGFGVDVAISNNKIVVGEPQYPVIESERIINNVGAAHVFDIDVNSQDWNYSNSLMASNWGEEDQFGYVVDLVDDTILVGSPFEDGSSPGINGVNNNLANSSGASYLFAEIEGDWQQVSYIKSQNPVNYLEYERLTTADLFGLAVALDGSTVVVGSPGKQFTSGAVYVYSRASMKIDQAHTGLWYNPNESGQGINFYLLEDNRVVVLWNTYDNEGNQQWLVGVGNHDEFTASLDVYTREGGSFPPIESESEAVYWGKANIAFSDCNTGYFNWRPLESNDYQYGSTQISRLTHTNGLSCGDKKFDQLIKTSFSMKDSNSTLWYNPSGEYLSNIFMLPNNRILYMWYTFDNNNQPIWLQGIGTHDGVRAEMDVYIFNGAKFNPNYNSNELNIVQWGKFELEFSGCSNGLFKWLPNTGNGFTSGEIALSRLTKTKGLTCID